MIQFSGIPVQGGLSVGPIHYLRRAGKTESSRSELSPPEELLRFEAARDRAVTELKRLEARIAAHLGSDEAAIFLFQSAMLEDADYLDVIRSYINASATAEYAVEQTEKAVIEFFASLDSSYLHARAADARDLSRRLTGILSDRADIGRLRQRPSILVAEDLSPSETALLDTGMLLGLVSRDGSVESHTAILAHAIGVPTVTGIPVDPRWEGRLAILDGDSGTLTIDPDEATLSAVRPHIAQDYAPVRPELTVAHLHRSAPELKLCAVIDSAWEAADAYAIGAGAVSSYRTRLLHDGRVTPPSEVEQLTEYRRTVDAMHGRPVTFQALRIDGLGTLASPDFRLRMKTQLRAVLRVAAAAEGVTALAFPGVRTKADIRCLRLLIRQCERELYDEGVPFRTPRVGAEIASPAAIFSADALAEESDFLLLDGEALMRSTIYGHAENDLPNYRALGWMLRRALLAGHRRGREVTMTGELGEFPQAVRALLTLGFDALAVPVRSLLPLYELLSVPGRKPGKRRDQP